MILGYVVIAALIITGIAAWVEPDRFADNPTFYFICALFVGSLIFSIRKSRKFFDKDADE